MTHYGSSDEQDTRPPDQASGGDVSTTGVSSHDVHQINTAHGSVGHDVADNAHGGHGGHGIDEDNTPDVSTLVPTTWKQLILPALILLLVGILVWGPISNAFAPQPATSPASDQHNTSTSTPSSGNAAASGNDSTATTSSSTAEPSPTTGAEPSPTTASLSPGAIATRTAVAISGEQGVVARVPVQLEVGSSTFVVKPGSNLLPDWNPPQDVGIATWIEGTFANHILYIPYSADNAALFTGIKQGENLRVVMNTGQVFVFAVNRIQRAGNGPATAEGQFTVSTAMRQDHAGITLFLIGDPATDRAVVQADFTGTIQ